MTIIAYNEIFIPKIMNIQYLYSRIKPKDEFFVYFCSKMKTERRIMEQDVEMLKDFYASYMQKVSQIKEQSPQALTYTEKIILTHLYDVKASHQQYKRGTDYVELRPNRVAMQDATAQMALLQFMNSGCRKVAVPATVHCDHLIKARTGAGKDLAAALDVNGEVYGFLQSVSAKYGIGFWKPGSGIIHQIVLENYAFPGGMMVGTDSHTPNAGGLGMVAVGVGGADTVDVLTGEPWQLKMPKIFGVKLTGKLSPWSSPKDVILKLLGMLTVKGGTNAVMEYFGEGVKSLSATGRATICNMGAELGATCSIFPYDDNTYKYLLETGRADAARLAESVKVELKADAAVLECPEKYYDKVLEIDLNKVEPYLNGPFTPDAATTVGEMKTRRKTNDWPQEVEVALIGSCTNSSYEDLSGAAAVAREAKKLNLKPKAKLIVCPGSEQIRATAERDGILNDLRAVGAVVMTNACGPCIGQWERMAEDNEKKNTIVTTFNRNFRRRADGNPNTFAFVASPVMVMALAIAGKLDFNPLTDKLVNEDGTEVMLSEPVGKVFPLRGFEADMEGYVAPHDDGINVEVKINPNSDRLQKLEPFKPWDGKDFEDLHLLIKTEGKCTTDHISMAGPWLKFRGHLEHISDNLLMGAVNSFNGESNSVLNQETGVYSAVSKVARYYKEHGEGSIVVAEDNYGEGSSREHAAMEPRFLNVKVILAKSFARIHETNLKKQGMLALTFQNKEDYDKVKEKDRISVKGLDKFALGSKVELVLKHEDGRTESFFAVHTYDEKQVGWFKAGSALNALQM